MYRGLILITIMLVAGCMFGFTVKEKPKDGIPKIIRSVGCTKRPVVIAVIDTGFGYLDKGHGAKLCNFGHKDFSLKQEYSAKYGTKDRIPLDNHGHGTNIAGIIDKYASTKHTNYCLVILKYYEPTSSVSDTLTPSIKAIEYATNIKVDYINYSGGGDYKSEEEVAAIKKFLDKGGKFIAAAGNAEPFKTANDITEHPYYPAMADERVIVVGNLAKSGKRLDSSNYGSAVKKWEVGESVEVYGIKLTGTSQATAIVTGKIVANTKRECN